MSHMGQSLPIHLAPVPANVRYYPNSDLSRWSFATHSARKRIVSISPIRRPAAAHDPQGAIRTFFVGAYFHTISYRSSRPLATPGQSRALRDKHYCTCSQSTGDHSRLRLSSGWQFGYEAKRCSNKIEDTNQKRLLATCSLADGSCRSPQTRNKEHSPYKDIEDRRAGQ